MNRTKWGIRFWWVVFLVGLGYHFFVSPLKFGNFEVGMLVVMALIEILQNIRELRKNLPDEPEQIKGKENLN